MIDHEPLMPSADKPSDSATILVVLVLYRRDPQEAASWRFLMEAIRRQPLAAPLQSLRCLVYDNSPIPSAKTDLPAGVLYQSNPANGGTAAAYAAALTVASTERCNWLLLLDQDTILPDDYFERAADALSAQSPNLPAALIPRVRHGNQLISPAVISRFGAISPRLLDPTAAGISTAISSGLLLRHEALASVFPLSPVFWLDCVDHMIFLSLARQGAHLAAIDIDISHDLSVQNPATISSVRFASILAAERAFCDALGPLAKATLPLRRLLRALRYLPHSRSHAITLLRNVLR